MPRILFLHGLGGYPNGVKVSALRAAFGQDDVRAVHFPFSNERLSQFVGEAVPQGLPHVKARITGMGVESEQLAREACDAHRPDVLVGCSLGGALALQLAAARGLPAVLLTPVWNTQIRGDYLHGFLKRLPGMHKYDHIVPLLAPLVLLWARHYAGFRFCTSMLPRTVILHAPEDELFDIRQSVTLLADNPLPTGGPEAALMTAVMSALSRRGYTTDGRLVKIGDDHQMDTPDVQRAMVDAVRLLCELDEATRPYQALAATPAAGNRISQ